MPSRPGRVLDVGCGAGRLAAVLATRSGHVDGLDRSPVMIDKARYRYPDVQNVRWIHGDVLDLQFPLPEAGYDAITAVSSLHHRPLEIALRRLATLTSPGGVVVIAGHYRPATLGDRLLKFLALPATEWSVSRLRYEAGRVSPTTRTCPYVRRPPPCTNYERPPPPSYPVPGCSEDCSAGTY